MRRVSSNSRKNPVASAIGCTAEHTSCSTPGCTTSAVRVPPPIVSAASNTVTGTPARASVTAAASPLGPAPITAAGFDPIWFGVILTINMELGLITPPVGLNLFVINGITPDVSLATILKGSLPFMLCMVLAILILCVFPELATWLPSYMMG